VIVILIELASFISTRELKIHTQQAKYELYDNEWPDVANGFLYIYI